MSIKNENMYAFIAALVLLVGAPVLAQDESSADSGTEEPPAASAQDENDEAPEKEAASDAGPPDTAPAVDEEEKKKPTEEEKKALEKKCSELEKKGDPLPDECKTLELEVVFQGGLGGNRKSPKPVAQATDSESQSLQKEMGEESEQAQFMEQARGRTVWDVAKMERPLFREKKSDYFAGAVAVGYPTIMERGSSLEDAYTPIIDVSAEIRYQLVRLLHVALVADFQAMKGTTVATTEVLPTIFYPDQDETAPNASPERHPREVGANLNSFIGVGVRPTLRLDFEWRRFQFITGVGFGWHFIHTSGEWRTKLPEEDRANSFFSGEMEKAQWKGDDAAFYEFKLNDSGLYTVFEAAVLYRLMEERLGVGIIVKYSVLLHGALEPDVTVKEDYNIGPASGYPADWQGYMARENDYGDTFIRHLGSMSLLSFGLMADWRF